ncbi:ABC transporter ATP-binding protein [Aliihoeflea sp. PC F10.4]
MTEKTEQVLSIRDLTIEAKARREWSRIVKDVNLDLNRGEVIGVVGESGAGKSTIGLAALGFLRAGCRAVSGQVLFDGHDLLAMSEAKRRQFRGCRIAYVAQSAAASFNPAKRLISQVVEAAVERGGQSPTQAREFAIELFRAMSLPDPVSFGDRFPHQVSGGQLQRAMTAMAMICRPDVIVFDEPTTALDVTTQVDVLLSIRRAIEMFGVAAIYISHDLAVVSQLADRVAVLRYGEVVENEPIDAILNAPKDDYTKSLWSVRSIQMPMKAGERELLTLKGVNASYHAFHVLKDIDLEVKRGQTVAVVGESGSGKSTLGRVITGLKDPSGGSVIFDGVEMAPTVAERSKKALQQIQIIYQSADTALNPRHTVRKIVGRPLKLLHGMRGDAKRRRILELLRKVELGPEYIDRLPGQLSGGQKQRVAIARALAADPELIVCDEITSALDKVVQAEILKMLDELQKQTGVSYLFITHDLEVVRAIADHVVVMQHGKVVESGTRDDLLAPPHQPYTEKLLDSVPEMSPAWLREKAAQYASGTPIETV